MHIAYFKNLERRIPNEVVDESSVVQSQRLSESQVEVEIRTAGADPQTDPRVRSSVSTEHVTYSWHNICAWVGAAESERNTGRNTTTIKSKFGLWKSENKSILNNGML